MTLLALGVITVSSNKAGIEVASIAAGGIVRYETASKRREQHAARKVCVFVSGWVKDAGRVFYRREQIS